MFMLANNSFLGSTTVRQLKRQLALHNNIHTVQLTVKNFRSTSYLTYCEPL